MNFSRKPVEVTNSYHLKQTLKGYYNSISINSILKKQVKTIGGRYICRSSPKKFSAENIYQNVLTYERNIWNRSWRACLLNSRGCCFTFGPLLSTCLLTALAVCLRNCTYKEVQCRRTASQHLTHASTASSYHLILPSPWCARGFRWSFKNMWALLLVYGSTKFRRDGKWVYLYIWWLLNTAVFCLPCVVFKKVSGPIQDVWARLPFFLLFFFFCFFSW